MFSFSQGDRGPGTASPEACFPVEGTPAISHAGLPHFHRELFCPDSDSRARVWAPSLRLRRSITEAVGAEVTGCHLPSCLQGQPNFFPAPPIPWRLPPNYPALTQATGPHSVKTDQTGTSLVAQWLRLCTPYARALVQSLVREPDPVCLY